MMIWTDYQQGISDTKIRIQFFQMQFLVELEWYANARIFFNTNIMTIKLN